MSRKGKDSKRETALTLNRLGSLTRELGRYDEVGRELEYFNKLIIGCVIFFLSLIRLCLM